MLSGKTTSTGRPHHDRKLKKFSRFLVWVLLAFEGASLSLVVGVLYTLLSNSIERDFHHQVEVAQVQTSAALRDRISRIAFRLHEVCLSNTIRVSIMLGLDTQVLETIKTKWPWRNGAYFFVREGGKPYFLPSLPDNLLAARQRLISLNPLDTFKPPKFEALGNGHYGVLLCSSIKRRQERLGTAYLIYDITSDNDFWSWVKLTTGATLLFWDKGLLIDLSTGHSEKFTGALAALGFVKENHDRVLMPLKGFPALFYSVTTEPLKSQKQDLIKVLLILCASVFFLTVVLSLTIARKVSRPLERLASQALVIARDPVKPIKIEEDETGHLEFRNLAISFNTLVNALVRAREELKLRAKKRLKESEDRYRRTFDASPSAITISTLAEGRFLDVNEAFCRLSGYAKSEVIGKTASELGLYQDSADRDVLLKILRMQGEVNNVEMNVRRKNGEERVCLISARSLNYGTEPCMVALATDITEQKKSQKEREKLESQLRQAQKMEAIGALAGGVAHDFRNILQGIFGYCDILLFDFKKGNKGYEEIIEIRKAAQRASELTHQLLTFSRKVESKLRPVDINEEIRQAIKLLSRTLPPTITIDLRLQEDLDRINADPAQIEQIILNLGINAKDAMPDGGILTIETECVAFNWCEHKDHLTRDTRKYVVLTVTDTGKGMDKETVAHIFEPFYTTKGEGTGTGLGLAMVYGIIKNHKGHIKCYSERGVGTSFKLYFPVLNEIEDMRSRPTEIRKAAPTGNGETVLIIDDDRAVLDSMAKVLNRFGYKVIRASDGTEALQIYKRFQEEIDLVILDYMMPGINGLRLIREIRKVRRNSRIVISSGYPLKTSKGIRVLDEVEGILRKPFEVEHMLRKIREILDAEP